MKCDKCNKHIEPEDLFIITDEHEIERYLCLECSEEFRHEIH